jgi:hypothetical protein
MFNIRKNKTLLLQYKKRKFPNSNVQLVAKKTGNVKITLTHFYSVKPSYER